MEFKKEEIRREAYPTIAWKIQQHGQDNDWKNVHFYRGPVKNKYPLTGYGSADFNLICLARGDTPDGYDLPER